MRTVINFFAHRLRGEPDLFYFQGEEKVLLSLKGGRTLVGVIVPDKSSSTAEEAVEEYLRRGA